MSSLEMFSSPDEALPIFEAWHTKGTLLRCKAVFNPVGFSLRGRVSSIKRSRVQIASEGGGGDWSLFLVPPLEAGRIEPASPEESTSGLLLRLPAPPDRHLFDTLTFEEVIEPE